MKKKYNFTKGAIIRGTIHSRSQVENAIREQQKTLTSIRLDKDIIDVAKLRAQEEGIGYLSWLNKKLRGAVLNELNSTDELKKRIEKLESVIFKKKAI
ncbi:MAG: hypothetical protein ABL927_00715 [Bdellovibrionales bacterium]